MPEEEGERAHHHSENDQGLLTKERSEIMARRLIPVGNSIIRPNG